MKRIGLYTFVLAMSLMAAVPAFADTTINGMNGMNNGTTSGYDRNMGTENYSSYGTDGYGTTNHMKNPMNDQYMKNNTLNRDKNMLNRDTNMLNRDTKRLDRDTNKAGIHSYSTNTYDNNPVKRGYRALENTENNMSNNWAWMGLLGLVGLFGLRGRSHDDRPVHK